MKVTNDRDRALQPCLDGTFKAVRALTTNVLFHQVRNEQILTAL